MANLLEIKKTLIDLFPKDSLDDTVWDYGFKFNFDRKIKIVAFSTNLTEFTISQAVKLNADLLITHHDAWPFMKSQREFCHKLLKDNKLNHCFFHLPLDAASFGTSSTFADLLNLTNTKKVLKQHDHLIASCGDIKPISLKTLQSKCEKLLDEKVRCFKYNDNYIRKILICTGGGMDTNCLDTAIEEGCDTYITGEYKMYLAHYAEFHKINLIIGSHTRTEILGVRSLVNKLKLIFNDINCIEITEKSY